MIEPTLKEPQCLKSQSHLQLQASLDRVKLSIQHSLSLCTGDVATHLYCAGKSFLLTHIITGLRKQHRSAVAVTAPTGIAATHINGMLLYLLGCYTNFLQPAMAAKEFGSASSNTILQPD